MSSYSVQVFWILLAVFVISFVYKLYRVFGKAGSASSDSPRSIVTESIPLWGLIILSAVLVKTGWTWAMWVGLVFTVFLVGMSIFYYNPVILPARNPGRVDWLEDMVYTGLLFLAGGLLVYHLAGVTLGP